MMHSVVVLEHAGPRNVLLVRTAASTAELGTRIVQHVAHQLVCMGGHIMTVVLTQYWC